MMVIQYFLYQRGDKAWIKLLVGYLCVSSYFLQVAWLIVKSMNWVITIYCQYTAPYRVKIYSRVRLDLHLLPTRRQLR